MPTVRRTPSSGQTRILSSRRAFASKRPMRSETSPRTRSSSRRSRSSRPPASRRCCSKRPSWTRPIASSAASTPLRSASLENDEPQTIDLASVESLPVTYALLVDASQSMHARMEFVRVGRRDGSPTSSGRTIASSWRRSRSRSERLPGRPAIARRSRAPSRQSRPKEARQLPTASSRPRAWWQVPKAAMSSC